MADNKQYYYLKLKDSFFDGEEMILLQNMKDGYLYTDILLKLYLRSLKCEGKLMFKNLIPYTPDALAQVTRHQVGTVEKALKVFKEMGLIEILDNGAIYMMDIQNFIGQSSTESDRVRAYRKRVAGEKTLPLQCNTNVQKCDKVINSVTNVTTDVQQMYDIITPEIEIEKELDLKIKKEKDIKHKYGEYKNVLLTEKEYQSLNSDFSNALELIKYLDEYIEMKGYKAKSHYLAIRKWVVNAVKERQYPKVPIIDYEEERKKQEELKKEKNMLALKQAIERGEI